MGRVNSINYLWGRISEPSVLVQIGFTVRLNRYQQDIPQYTYNFSEIKKKTHIMHVSSCFPLTKQSVS